MPKIENARLLIPGHRYTITLDDCCVQGTLQGTFLRWELPDGAEVDADDPFSSSTGIFDIGRLKPGWGAWSVEPITDTQAS